MRISMFKWLKRYALPLILVGGLLLTATGCAGSAADFSNPRDYVYNLLTRYMEGKLTLEDLYTNELANVSKTVIKKEEFLSLVQPTLEGVTLSEVKVKDAEPVELAENRVPYRISKVNLDVTYTKNGEKSTAAQSLYTIWQGSSIKIMYKNYLGKVTKEMTLTSDSNPVHCTALDVYTLPKGTALGIHFQNDTADTYQFGNGTEGAAVTVTTDKTNMGIARDTVTAGPGATAMVMVDLPQVSGDIQRILVSRFYVVGADGTLSPSGDGLSYAMSIVIPTT